MNRGVAVSETSSPSRNPFAWILLILALGFGIGITFPYWSLDITESRLTVGSELQYSVLIVHICTAAVALVLGPLQFMPDCGRTGGSTGPSGVGTSSQECCPRR